MLTLANFLCRYTATQAGSLKIHIISKHEGVTHPFDQCDYTATTAGGLKIHIN